MQQTPDVPTLTPLTFRHSLAAMHHAVATAMTPAPTTRPAYEQALVETLNALMPAATDHVDDLAYFLHGHPTILRYDVFQHGDAEARASAQEAGSLASLLCTVLYDVLYQAAMHHAPEDTPR